MMERVIDVTELDFEERVLEASKDVPVVVDFWAGWCRPCLVLGPVLERLADEYEGRFVLARVDVDANQSLSAAFGIQGIPAVKAFRNGGVVDEFVGVQPEEVVRTFLDGIVPSPAEDLWREGRAAEGAGDVGRAEAAYREAAKLDPAHEGAAVSLARLLAERGEEVEARALVSRFASSEEARALLARLELAAGARDEADVDELRGRSEADPDDVEAALALAAADAAAGRHRDGLERCVRIVERRGEGRDAARDLAVRIFAALGNDHPLTLEYRPRLASALF